MNDAESKQLLLDIKHGFENHSDVIVQTIEKTVNGKIDRLTSNFNEWKRHETEEREKVKTALDEYMKKTEPMVAFFEDMTSSKRVLFWLLGGLASVGAFYLMIREIFK